MTWTGNIFQPYDLISLLAKSTNYCNIITQCDVKILNHLILRWYNFQCNA